MRFLWEYGQRRRVCIRKITLDVPSTYYRSCSLSVSLSLFLLISGAGVFSLRRPGEQTLATPLLPCINGPIIFQRNCCPVQVSPVSRLNPRGTQPDFTRHGAIRDSGRGGRMLRTDVLVHTACRSLDFRCNYSVLRVVAVDLRFLEIRPQILPRRRREFAVTATPTTRLSVEISFKYRTLSADRAFGARSNCRNFGKYRVSFERSFTRSGYVL